MRVGTDPVPIPAFDPGSAELLRTSLVGISTVNLENGTYIRDKKIHIIRIEMFCPFTFQDLDRFLDRPWVFVWPLGR